MSTLLWGNPLAWIGALAVALPILVHLFAAARARRVPFPTLRFLPAAPPTALRARRIQDGVLLLVRCLIVLAAVAALAQPWLAWDGRSGGRGDDLPLAVVVDTGASMARPAAGGGAALVDARAEAQRLVEQRAPAHVIEATDLAGGIAAANVWLAAAGGADGAGEIVVLSDFQRGALARADLAALPAAVGIRFSPIEVTAAADIELWLLRAGEQSWSVGADVDGETTLARWRARSTPAAVPIAALSAPDLVAADGDIAAVLAAAAAAARVVATPLEAAPLDGAPRAVTVVWPGAPRRDELRAAVATPDTPWMADVLVALPDEAAVTAGALDGRLYLFAGAAPGSLASAELLAALRRAAVVPVAALDELEPETIDARQLRAWQRPAEAAPRPTGNDGRWLWVVALGLLVVEHGLRRRSVPALAPPASAAAERRRDEPAAIDDPVAEDPPYTTDDRSNADV